MCHLFDHLLSLTAHCTAGYTVIVAGDINDYSAAVPDAVSSKPTSRVLQILTDGLPGGASGASAVRLRNVMALVPQAERYTGWWDRDGDDRDDGVAGGEFTAIDHVLVPPELWDLITDVTFDHEVRAEARLSDHWPIVVTFGSRRGPALADVRDSAFFNAAAMRSVIVCAAITACLACALLWSHLP